MLRRIRSSIIIILLVLISASNICAAEEKLLRDSWFIIEQDEKPVGFFFGEFFQVTDGYSYQFDATIKMDFLGTPVNITEHIQKQVDQQFRLKSLEITSKTNEVQTKTVVQCHNGEINVLITDENGDQHKSHWQIKEDLYSSDSVVDYLFTNKDIQVGQEYVMTCWNIVDHEPQKTTIVIEEKIIDEYNGNQFTGFRIRITDELTDNLVIVDDNGAIYRNDNLSQNLTTKKVEKGEIPELQSIAMDVLLVPGNIKISHPFRSTTSQIRVQWRTVDNDQFNWEDNRQQLVMYNQLAESQEVLLKIEQDNRDFTGRVKVPVTKEVFSPYLEKTEYINPHLPEIQELVEEIIGKTNDGWLVTEKLVNWVYGFINNDLIVETLTTEEILARQSGKCVEYAVLFASLARSAGLPTRLVLGERYINNNWIGHMWNEVWLGEWIAIDPSNNQVSPDALLLKFVDSNTVIGTQTVRQGLIGQLDIEILDVQLSQAESEEVLETGINGQTYTNADFNCRITAPKSWQLIETEEQGIPLLIMQPVDPIAQGTLIMFNIPEGTTSEQMLKSRITALKNILPSLTLTEQGNALLANKLAAYGTWTIDVEGSLIRQQNWVLVHQDLCYILVFGVADELWADYQNYFQEILDNFEHID